MGQHALDLASFWLRLGLGLIAAALTWFVSADYGVSLVSRWTNLQGAARLGVGAALGYALLGTSVAALGLIGAIHPWTMYALLAAAIAIRLPFWSVVARVYSRATNTNVVARIYSRATSVARWWNELAYPDRLACVVIAAAILTGIVAAALPAAWWDPIAYHLPLVASALARGSFVFSPQMVQTGFPQLGEAAALPAYAIAGSAGAAMTTLGAGCCLGLLVYALASRIAPGSGVVAAMLVTSSGLWLWLAPSFYVDVPFAMFVVASLATIFLQAPTPSSSEWRVANLFATALFVGILSGAAAAVKYSGLATAPIVLIVAVLVLGRGRLDSRALQSGPKGPMLHQSHHPFRITAALLVGFGIVAAGWYARSFLVAGDPAYPFASAILAQPAAVKDFATRYVDMTRHWCGGGNSFSDLVLLPYRLIATPRTFCGDPGFALRAGIIWAVIGLVTVRSTLVIGIVTAVLTIAWFLASQQWRFAVAPLSLYAVIVAAGASHIVEGIAAVGARIRTASVLALSVLGAYSILINWLPSTRYEAAQSVVPAIQYILGRESAEQYLQDRLETFSAAQWLAQRGVRGGQILALDDVRDYYFPPGTLWGNPYYQQALALDWQATPQSRYGVLRGLGIRYIVVNANPAYTHRTPTGVDWGVLAADLHAGLHADYTTNDVTVYDFDRIVTPGSHP